MLRNGDTTSYQTSVAPTRYASVTKFVLGMSLLRLLFQQLAQILRGVLYQCTEGEQRALVQYIDKRQFDFCIDGGVRVENLPALEQSEWPVIQAGTIVTMRVISKTCFASYLPITPSKRGDGCQE